MHDRPGERAESLNGVIRRMYRTARKCLRVGSIVSPVADLPEEFSPDANPQGPLPKASFTQCHFRLPFRTRCHPIDGHGVPESANRDVDEDREVLFHHTPSMQ